MKPLLFRTDNFLTAGCFIGALGLSHVVLIVCAQTPALAEEIGIIKQSDVTRTEMATTRLLAQAVTAIEVRPEADVVTVVVAGDGQLFPEANFLDESRLIVDIPAVSSTLRGDRWYGPTITCSKKSESDTMPIRSGWYSMYPNARYFLFPDKITRYWSH